MRPQFGYNRVMHLHPYETKNLVFLDTEFTDLDPNKGELLSIGIVTLDGRELYIECEQIGDASPWVEKHIIPMLDGPKFSREQVSRQIRDFLGSSNPFVVAFVDNYDVIYLTKLFGAGKLPFQWMTIDFASILFANGINPLRAQRDGGSGVKTFYAELGIELKDYRNHHALDDAKLLRDVWMRLTTEKRDVL